MDAQVNDRIRHAWTSAMHHHFACHYPHHRRRFTEMLGQRRAPLEQ
jgi:hypothetical protein